MTLKARVVNAGLRQKDLINKLRERGVLCSPTDVSQAISYKWSYPKSVEIREHVIDILNEMGK